MKNKYLVFASIGFELVTLLLIAIYLGDYLYKSGYTSSIKAFLIVGAFLIWFISLILKLKKIEKNKSQNND